MDHPLEFSMEGGRTFENLFQPAGIRENVSTASYGLNKLYFAHANEPLVLELIDLGHHRTIKTQKYVSLKDRASQAVDFLNY